MSEYLNENGLALYDSQIKAYIGAVFGQTAGIIIATLNAAPTSSTTTYTIDGTSYNFKVGDEAMYNNSGTMKYYKLEALSSGVATWKEINGSVGYGDVLYTVQAPAATSGAISIDGSKPLHVITLSGNATSVSLSTEPAEGHSCHVIFVSNSSSYTRSIAISYNATSRITPDGAAMSLTAPKAGSGYIEVDFLRANSKTYVRGV